MFALQHSHCSQCAHPRARCLIRSSQVVLRASLYATIMVLSRWRCGNHSACHPVQIPTCSCVMRHLLFVRVHVQITSVLHGAATRARAPTLRRRTCSARCLLAPPSSLRLQGHTCSVFLIDTCANTFIYNRACDRARSKLQQPRMWLSYAVPSPLSSAVRDGCHCARGSYSPEDDIQPAIDSYPPVPNCNDVALMIFTCYGLGWMTVGRTGRCV
jgi:hypothetical protein